jgi:hypothetical protein
MQPTRTAESKRLKMGGKINTTNRQSDFLQSIRFLANKTPDGGVQEAENGRGNKYYK